MPDGQDSKKSAIVKILYILKRYSHAGRKLTQQDILSYLKSDYDTVIDRRAVKRNIVALQEVDDRVETDEKGGTYYEGGFSNAEMTMVLHALRGDRGLHPRDVGDLVGRLCDNMTTRYFIPANTNAEDKLVYIADEDMKTEEKYLDSRLYGIIQDAYDNALSYSYPNRNGIPVRFENVRTGRIIRSGGFYYLLGYTDITTAFAHRIDMISNYEKKQAPWDFRYFKWMKNDGLLPTIAASLPCERVEEPVELVLSADGRGAMKIRDRFGNLAVRYSADGDGSSLFKITLMPEAAARFAAEWCDCVTVKAPLSIAARVREILTNAKAKYD